MIAALILFLIVLLITFLSLDLLIPVHQEPEYEQYDPIKNWDHWERR